MVIKELTKAEEQVMQLLWQLNEAIVKDIIALMPSPSKSIPFILKNLPKLSNNNTSMNNRYTRKRNNKMSTNKNWINVPFINDSLLI